MSLFAQSAVVTPMSSSTTDVYGNQILAAGATVTYTKARLFVPTSSENTVDRNTAAQESTVAILAEGGVEPTVDTNDRIAIGGKTWEVTGSPIRVTRPTSTVLHHVEIPVKVVE